MRTGAGLRAGERTSEPATEDAGQPLVGPLASSVVNHAARVAHAFDCAQDNLQIKSEGVRGQRVQRGPCGLSICGARTAP